MQGVHCDSVLPQRFDDRIDLSSKQYEISSDRRLSVTSRLEVQGCRHAHRWRNCHTRVGNCLRSRHCDLKDSTINLPGVSENLLDLLLVETKFGCGRGCGRGIGTGSFSQSQCVVDCFGHLHGIAAAGDVHVHHMGRFSKQVIMDSGFVYAALLKLHHDGFDLVFSENQIAHDHGSAAIALECCPRTQREGGLDIDAIEHHVKIFSRHSKLDHVTRLDLSGTYHRLLDLLPVVRITWSTECLSHRQSSAIQGSCRDGCRQEDIQDSD